MDLNPNSQPAKSEDDISTQFVGQRVQPRDLGLASNDLCPWSSPQAKLQNTILDSHEKRCRDQIPSFDQHGGSICVTQGGISCPRRLLDALH